MNPPCRVENIEPPSMIDYVWIKRPHHQLQEKRMQKTPLTCATWIFSFPNSFAKLWLKARTPCFPTEKALVSGPPLKLAVAPVKIKVPLFPLDCSISLSLNAKMVAREKEKAAATPVCNTAWTSLGVMSRNFLKTGSPTLYTAARIVNSCLGYRAWMADQVEVMSSSEYDGVEKGVAYSLPFNIITRQLSCEIMRTSPPEEFISSAILFTTSLPRATSATLYPFLANNRLLTNIRAVGRWKLHTEPTQLQHQFHSHFPSLVTCLAKVLCHWVHDTELTSNNQYTFSSLSRHLVRKGRRFRSTISLWIIEVLCQQIDSIRLTNHYAGAGIIDFT